MNKTVCALLAAVLLALAAWYVRHRCAPWTVWWTASVRKRKAAPPDGRDRAGPEGETVTSSLASVIQEV